MEMKLKSQKYQNASLDKALRPQKKEESSQIGPWLLGIFLFVILGSTLFQILNMTNSSTDDILIWMISYTYDTQTCSFSFSKHTQSYTKNHSFCSSPNNQQ